MIKTADVSLAKKLKLTSTTDRFKYVELLQVNIYIYIWEIKTISLEISEDNLKNDKFNKPIRREGRLTKQSDILQAYSNKRPPVLFSRVPVLFLNGAGSLSAAVGEPSWREVTVTNFYKSRKMAKNKDDKRSRRRCFRVFTWTRNHAFTDLNRWGGANDSHESAIIFIRHIFTEKSVKVLFSNHIFEGVICNLFVILFYLF